MPIKPRSIAQSFADLRGRGIGLVPFLPAGFPDLDTTSAALAAVDAAGPAAIEIGFPFSDPIADGPIIQQAFTAALERKLKVRDIFEAIRDASPRISSPLVAMLSYSIIFRYGAERFFADARAAGFAGVIVPDLPPPEANKTCRQIGAAGLDATLLIAPTTTAQRRREIAALCTGFVYYLSVSGVTGAQRTAAGPGPERPPTEEPDRPPCLRGLWHLQATASRRLDGHRRRRGRWKRNRQTHDRFRIRRPFGNRRHHRRLLP